jgi:hypothetical protein
MRAIGTSTSSAVVGVVLAHMTTRLGSLAVPSEAGFRTAFAMGAGGAVLALLIATLIPGKSAGRPTATAAGAPAGPQPVRQG